MKIQQLLWIVFAAGAVAMSVLGLGRGEWAVVYNWAITLCTSCIGLG